MNAHHAFPRHGEHAKRVIIPQIVLGSERKSRQILQALKIGGMDAGRIKRVTIMRDVGVRMMQCRREQLPLKVSDGAHTMVPPMVRECPRNSAITAPFALTLTS